jgi:hypothetical protein
MSKANGLVGRLSIAGATFLVVVALVFVVVVVIIIIS